MSEKLLTNETQITGRHNYEGLNTTANTNNKLSGFGYDAAGNMTSNGTITYTYDAENRLVYTSGYRYIYDANGERVEKCQATSATEACPTSGTTGTLYWRGTGSDTLAETDLGGNNEEEYLFFGGQRIARRDVTDDNSGGGCVENDFTACVTATPQDPCVVFIGGTGDGDYDSAFTNAAAATGTAVYITSYPITSYPGFILTDLGAEAYDSMPGGSATPCGGTCQDVSAQINALEQANPQGLLLIPYSGGALPVNQGAGNGALNTTGINGIIYFSPGSPAGYAPELNSIPTFTYWGKGLTDSLVYAANGTEFNGGGIWPTYSGLPPGSSATTNCGHDFGCEYGDSGLGNTLQSDCNPSTSENRSDDDQNEEKFAVRPKDSDGDKGIAEVDTWLERGQRGQL